MIRHKYGHKTGITLDTITLEQEQQLYNISANSQTKASLLRHKRRITALVTQQYTAAQQVYTRVHTIYTTTQLSTQSTSVPITR